MVSSRTTRVHLGDQRLIRWFGDEGAENSFGHCGAADVSEADEEDGEGLVVCHFFNCLLVFLVVFLVVFLRERGWLEGVGDSRARSTIVIYDARP